MVREPGEDVPQELEGSRNVSPVVLAVILLSFLPLGDEEELCELFLQELGFVAL